MTEKAQSLLKIGAVSALGGLIVVIITILGYAGGAVDTKIDSKINVHSLQQEAVQHKMRRDIAVIKVQQETIKDDIAEIKDMVKEAQ